MAMKCIHLLFIILICNSLVAQRIGGRVVDSANGHGLPGVTVELNNARAIATNDSGFFSFNVKPGRYTVRLTTIGYAPLVKTVEPSNSIMEFKLNKLPLFIDPVEIKAIRASEKSPFTKTEITKQQIARNNLGQDLPYLLNQTPSVVVNSDAGNGVGYTGIRIRGTDPSRINMTINGIPYNDAESQGLFFVNLPDLASSVQSIQIQRGAGTSSNGAGAFGATMNFSTNEVITDPYAEINNSYGSFNTRKHTVKAGTGLISDHFTMDARLSSIHSDGYVERAATDLQSFYISGGYLKKKSSFRINIFSGKEKTYQAWYGIPASDLHNNRRINYAGTEKPGAPYDNETDNYQQHHYQVFFNHQFSPRITFNTAIFLTNGKGYYEQYKAAELYSDYGLTPRVINTDTLYETDLIRQLWLKNHFYGQIASLQYKHGKHHVTAGGGWNQYDGTHFGKIIWSQNGGIPEDHTWYDLNAIKKDVNTYVKYHYTVIPSIYLFGDLQYRQVAYDLFGFRDNPTLEITNRYNFFNPKFGITILHKNYQWYASYSRAAKEPNRDDFEAGAAQQPVPEILNDIEAGVERKTPTYGWSVTGYHMSYKNQLVLTGRINDVGAYTRTNIPESYRMGIELQGWVYVTNQIHLSGNLTVSRNRIKDFTEYIDDYDLGGQKQFHYSSTDISFSPKVIASANLTLLPIRDLEINLFSKFVERQYLDNSSNMQRSVPSFFTQDLRLSYTFRKGFFKELGLNFLINNIFDTKFEPNGYTYSYFSGGMINNENYYYPAAGINVLAGLQVKL